MLQCCVSGPQAWRGAAGPKLTGQVRELVVYVFHEELEGETVDDPLPRNFQMKISRLTPSPAMASGDRDLG